MALNLFGNWPATLSFNSDERLHKSSNKRCSPTAPLRTRFPKPLIGVKAQSGWPVTLFVSALENLKLKKFSGLLLTEIVYTLGIGPINNCSQLKHEVLMKFFFACLFFSLSTMAAETAPVIAKELAPTTPKQACEALAKAAAEDNFTAFAEGTAMPPMIHEGMAGHDKSCPMMDHKDKKCTKKNCPMHKEEGKHAMPGMHGMHGMPTAEDFHKMHEKEMERLKTLTCKDEKIAGDHAWVEAISQNETRLVPFKLVDGKWKFDMHTYHSFYQPQLTK